jgi:hypothetical protein
MTITEHDLASAVYELSLYVSSLPSREEAQAINDEAMAIFVGWIYQQNWSREEFGDQIASLSSRRRIRTAAEQGRKQWLQRRSS